MDILEANFPQMFPQKDLIRDARNATASLKFAGDRGHAPDEEESPGDTIHADEVFLKSLIETLDSVRLRILLFMSEHPAVHPFETLPEDVNDHMQIALGEYMKVSAELKRLGARPELFGDLRMQQETFQAARKKMIELRDLLKIAIGRQELFEHANESLRSLAPRVIEPPDEEVPPWLTWCRSLPTTGNHSLLERMRDSFPTMTPARLQLLPAQGVLIAERRRQRVETRVTRAMELSPNPARLQKQKPNKERLVEDEELQEGVEARWSSRSGAIRQTEQTQGKFAFGKQEPTADLARFLAGIDGDVTTRNDRNGVLRVLSRQNGLSQEEI